MPVHSSCYASSNLALKLVSLLSHRIKIDSSLIIVLHDWQAKPDYQGTHNPNVTCCCGCKKDFFVQQSRLKADKYLVVTVQASWDCQDSRAAKSRPLCEYNGPDALINGMAAKATHMITCMSLDWITGIQSIVGSCKVTSPLNRYGFIRDPVIVCSILINDWLHCTHVIEHGLHV